MALTPETPSISAGIVPPGGGAGGIWAAPPRSFRAVSKSDTVALPPNVRGLWVGGAGDLAVKGIGDVAAVTITAVPAGTFIPGQFAYVMSANTTATLVVSFIE